MRWVKRIGVVALVAFGFGGGAYVALLARDQSALPLVHLYLGILVTILAVLAVVGVAALAVRAWIALRHVFGGFRHRPA